MPQLSYSMRKILDPTASAEILLTHLDEFYVSFCREALPRYLEEFKKNDRINPITKKRISSNTVTHRLLNRMVALCEPKLAPLILPVSEKCYHPYMIDAIVAQTTLESHSQTIFPRSYELNSDWREAWLRKLNRSAHRPVDPDCKTPSRTVMVVHKGHTLSWVYPVGKMCDDFVGVDFLCRIHDWQHVRVTENRILFLEDSRVFIKLLDGNVLLDDCIRIVPALGYVNRSYPAPCKAHESTNTIQGRTVIKFDPRTLIKFFRLPGNISRFSFERRDSHTIFTTDPIYLAPTRHFRHYIVNESNFRKAHLTCKMNATTMSFAKCKRLCKWKRVFEEK